ncbi:hypothetical protein MAUB_64070 (plasmid) [Mycolicibacterium aubagnense]|uniref:HTH cro/C1-type domain-containing protein n=1 Tax=Mycolicibacterium aubagnense TaxID=319707 RepID=A0ABN5Z4R0_9MYCO|nr:XRE family transcriptional regulator [Mycolicibacterium aubagnense]BBX88206.1 hypothetical protein MAUB_64070 [Mycolicibacterium aubagnense]
MVDFYSENASHFGWHRDNNGQEPVTADADTTPTEALLRVGQFVKRRRRERGFASQQELADAAEVTLSTAALLERGKTFPRSVNLAKFEAALAVPPGTLRAIRDNLPLPEERGTATAPPLPPSTAAVSGTSKTDVLAIATVAAELASVCAGILVESGPGTSQAKAGINMLSEHLFRLESLITALFLDSDNVAMDEVLAAMKAVHDQRIAVRDLAANF